MEIPATPSSNAAKASDPPVREICEIHPNEKNMREIVRLSLGERERGRGEERDKKKSLGKERRRGEDTKKKLKN